MADYRELIAWQVAHELALAVGRRCQRLPRHERFELASQLRRAALSVPANLVEGRARYGTREYLRFVRIAGGSCAEVGYLLLFARDMEYLESAEFDRLDALRKRSSVLINRLAQSLERAHG